MKTRTKFLNAIRKVIGTRYRWGGQSPEDGFDCSGLILWGMNEAGMTVPDMSANGLWLKYEPQRIDMKWAKPGCLMFYGDEDGDIDHVMVVLNVWEYGPHFPLMTLVGARGGDMLTIDAGTAYSKHAFVDTVIGDYWHTRYRGCADPFLEYE